MGEKLNKTVNTVYSDFLRALEFIIKSKGHGYQKELSAEIGIVSSYLNAVYKNKKIASFALQVKIAAVAGYTYDQFLSLGHDLNKNDRISPKLFNIHKFKPIKTSQPLTIIDNHPDNSPAHTAMLEHFFAPFRYKKWAYKIYFLLVDVEMDRSNRDTIERVIKAIAALKSNNQIPDDRLVQRN
jgi:hypothetical protein